MSGLSNFSTVAGTINAVGTAWQIISQNTLFFDISFLLTGIFLLFLGKRLLKFALASIGFSLGFTLGFIIILYVFEAVEAPLPATRRPIIPDWAKIVIGIVVGLLLGIGLAFLFVLLRKVAIFLLGVALGAFGGFIIYSFALIHIVQPNWQVWQVSGERMCLFSFLPQVGTSFCLLCFPVPLYPSSILPAALKKNHAGFTF
mmetsp:Transcript_29065/g.74635  ORF Transcript_29065/g.74635 Transcript_29065/m.74635 type:complete len:201 (-) Transcript_29065:2528-3130(-)